MEFFNVKDMQDVNWRYCAYYLKLRWHRLDIIKRLILIGSILCCIYIIVQINRGMKVDRESNFPVTLVKTDSNVIKPCLISQDPSADLQLSTYTNSNSFAINDIVHKYTFDKRKDTMVFFHIQKTSGANFMQFLKKSLSDGLFISDKEVTKDRACSPHMDYARMSHCVAESQWYGEPKTPHVLTMLRDPTHRYLSEWLHLKSKERVMPPTTYHCNCKPCKLVYVPKCLLSAELPPEALQSEQLRLQSIQRQPKNRLGDHLALQNATTYLQRWTLLELEHFLNCHDNPAANRQVRMLSDYDVMNSDCSKFDQLFLETKIETRLESAKNNLREMAFFGLAEYQKQSEQLFYSTFGFSSNLNQNTQDHVSCLHINDELRNWIKEKNVFDYKLYDYAKDLFFQRLHAARIY